MSNDAVNWAYRQKCPSPGAKFVLVTLCDFADEHGHCYPSHGKLAAMTQQGLRTVVAHIADLEAAGLIKREQRFRKDGGKTSDGYTIQCDPIRENGVSHTQDSRIPPAKMAYPPVQDSRIPHTRVSHLNHQSINHQIEPSEIRESVRPSRSITRAHEQRFSPANHSLTEEEIAADAAACETTPEKLLAIIPQWADSRSSSGGTSRDWRADLRKFARSYLEREPTKATGSARASPKSFTAIKLNETIEGMAAWNAQMDEQEQASGTHHLQSANGPTEHRLRPGTERAAPVHVLGSGTKPSR